MTDQVRPFDLRGALPEGVTVLEASAGTGKTYTIAALATRYIADGRPLRELLLVTFTRMATGELRERVRERLVDTEQQLSAFLAGASIATGDELSTLLAEGPRTEVECRRDRLAGAIANFDAATIATTHGFCLEVLAELGTLGDLEPDVAFVEDVNDLVEEVIDDLYVRRFFREGDPPFGRREAGQIARIAIENPTVPIHPLESSNATASMRQRLALAARRELDARKRQLAIMTFDDLLTRLRDALVGPNGAAAARRLRQRYRIVLIDEFQDTDPVQWEIVKTAFGTGECTLVLIADPKQAIYAFRGADVYAYLQAAGAAGSRSTQAVNWRSDQALIDAHDALFGGTRLGHPGIVYREVRATPANQKPRLLGAPSAAALRVRLASRDEPSITKTKTGFASAPSARAFIAKDLAADIVSLLASGAEIERRLDDGTVCEREPVRPGHVAVLVRSRYHAHDIHAELAAADIPAVINGAGSVFGTAAARDWLTLLQALERPAYSPWARAAALTPLLGWSAERLALADEADLEQLHQRLHGWARVLRVRGVAALAETISLTEHLPSRVLATVDGERELTDLQHVAELLHGAATAEQLGIAALTAWLRQRINEAGEDSGREERTRRLESDADAVQVLTIHRSKGLEFPIVYCPFLWELGGRRPRTPVPVYFHDADAGDERAIDVGLVGSEYRRHQQQYVSEERGEDLRLMYVALTRAKHRAVIWWASSYASHDSPLGRLLFARDEHGNVAPAGSKKPSDEDVQARFEKLATSATGGAIEIERAVLGTPVSHGGPPASDEQLAVARFDRRLDVSWRRTSYTDITARAHETFVGSEPEVDVVSDEPAVVLGAPASPSAADGADIGAAAMPTLLGAMPAGARIGTFVHRVLQATDFATGDLPGELAEHVATLARGGRVEIGDPGVVIAGLAAAIETPFGDERLRLRDLARGDRLDELEFELPLAGGDAPEGEVTVAAIAGVMDSLLGSDDPLAGYAARLADPLLRHDVRGYLTGSIDLVARAPGAGGRPRFAIVDYKTNRLAGPDDELTVWDYRPAALTAEMEASHYGLQAILYAVALHRYLRWRLPGYDPDRDLAGVHYLFLRGMVGPDTPLLDGGRCGVFSWHPPSGLVTALSSVLDGEPVA